MTNIQIGTYKPIKTFTYFYIKLFGSLTYICIIPITLMNSVQKAIRDKTGMNVMDFVRDELKLGYQTFCARLRRNSLRLEDYHRITAATGMTFEELFPNPLVKKAPKHLQRITLTIPAPLPVPPVARVKGKSSGQPLPKDFVQMDHVVIKHTPADEDGVASIKIEPVKQVKKEETLNDIPFVDIYEEGGPPDEQSETLDDPKVTWKPVIPDRKR
jgi:hypothetical protein